MAMWLKMMESGDKGAENVMTKGLKLMESGEKGLKMMAHG